MELSAAGKRSIPSAPSLTGWCFQRLIGGGCFAPPHSRHSTLRKEFDGNMVHSVPGDCFSCRVSGKKLSAGLRFPPTDKSRKHGALPPVASGILLFPAINSLSKNKKILGRRSHQRYTSSQFCVSLIKGNCGLPLVSWLLQKRNQIPPCPRGFGFSKET